MGPCIEWTKARNKAGYGVMWVAALGKTQLVHRVVMAAPPGAVVRHKCDNPACYNRDHLIVGTQKENVRDALESGRMLVGDINGKSTITDELAQWVRESTQTQRTIAHALGISQAAVSMIRTQKRRAYGLSDTRN